MYGASGQSHWGASFTRGDGNNLINLINIIMPSLTNIRYWVSGQSVIGGLLTRGEGTI